MKKIVLILLGLLTQKTLYSQLPDTDLFSAEITYGKGQVAFSTPVNITNRTGYDNQPTFLPDGNALYFVSVRDTSQSDVFHYSFASKKISQVTFTKESEYSPSLFSNGKSITVVRVDGDGGQRLYQLPNSKNGKPEFILNSDSVGYYCWLNDSIVSMFILGPSQTLQLLNTHTAERKLIASDIGRCMKLSPDKKFLYFVIKQNQLEWGIYKMDVSTHTLEKVIATIPGNEDYAFLPDGTLLMGSEGKLFGFHPSIDKEWKLIADFSSSVKSFYRISVNSKGDRIVFVAYTGKKP